MGFGPPPRVRMVVVHSPLRIARADQFVTRLSIMSNTGEVRSLHPLWHAQWRLVDMFQQYEKMLVVKPRQMGSTTVLQALLFWWAYWAKDPISVLTVGHEQGSCDRVNRMLRHYAQTLPQGFRPTLEPDNGKEITLAHNGATFRQLMAGGRGQGRSYTYQAVCFTELGKFPQGSAATKGTNVDKDVVHSTLATCHRGPYRKIIMESTGDGPDGVFRDYAQIANDDPSWGFEFFSWFDFPHYQAPVPPGFSPTEEEERLIALHGVTHSQLAWKRQKLGPEGYTRLRFRREYPETWEEPFLPVEDGAWFDVELLNRVLARLGPPNDAPLVIYTDYDPGHHYAIGLDTSGGTGRDFASLWVLRDDLEVCARWRSNITSLDGQAQMAVKMSMRFGSCVILTEANNFGRPVIKRIEELGGRAWKDEKGKDWWTQDGRAGQSKRMMYAYMRRMVNEAIACSAALDEPSLLNDPYLVRSLIGIQEDDRGRIQGPNGQNDDDADGWGLALWAVKRYHANWVASSRPTRTDRLKTDLRRVFVGH